MAFSEEIIQKVWEKGYIDSNYNPAYYRKDQFGYWIGRQFYGDRNSQYGWEIDHIKPVVEEGSDDIYNLRPLNWRVNVGRK